MPYSEPPEPYSTNSSPASEHQSDIALARYRTTSYAVSHTTGTGNLSAATQKDSRRVPATATDHDRYVYDMNNKPGIRIRIDRLCLQSLRMNFVAGLFLSVLVTIMSPATATDPYDPSIMAPLPITAETVVARATENGILTPDEFVDIRDPHVGKLLVGRPDREDGSGTAISVIVFDQPSGPPQIQIIITAPWENLTPRIELAASIVSELVSLPTYLPPPPPTEIEPEPMSPMATWLYGRMYEAWLGWPGLEQRQVRVRDGIALIFEGTPPENWSITLTMNQNYRNEPWPETWNTNEPPEITQARDLILAGEYGAAAALLFPLAADDNPQAAVLMGDMYRFGRLGPPEIKAATDWYLVAGRYRHAYAIWSIAALVTEAWGRFFISNLKAPLIVSSARAGSANAFFVLAGTSPGVNYVRPEGVTAADQYLQAARWDHLAAQHEIAGRYANGEGLERDPVEALAWALVARNNTPPGRDYIFSRQFADNLARGLTDDEIMQAETRARQLLAPPPVWPYAHQDDETTEH